MTKEEIVAERKRLTDWIVEQQRIYNEKMWLLDAEADRFPEDRKMMTADLAMAYAEIEKPKAVAEVLGKPIEEGIPL